MTPIKALSVRQPWAWAIVAGHKTIENRTRRLSYRGPLLIHASLFPDFKLDRDGCEWFRNKYGLKIPRPPELQYGGIIGMAYMVDCVEHSDNIWFEGPFGYVMLEQRPLPFVPCKGQLGLWTPGPEVQERLQAYL